VKFFKISEFVIFWNMNFQERMKAVGVKFLFVVKGCAKLDKI
jgi:hypothetical protein